MKVLKYKCKIPREGRTSSKNVATLNIFVHDVINLLHFEQRTDKGNYFYLLYSLSYIDRGLLGEVNEGIKTYSPPLKIILITTTNSDFHDNW